MKMVAADCLFEAIIIVCAILSQVILRIETKQIAMTIRKSIAEQWI